MHKKQPKPQRERASTSMVNYCPNFSQHALAILALELCVLGIMQHVPFMATSFTQYEGRRFILAAACSCGLFILFAVL